MRACVCMWGYGSFSFFLFIVTGPGILSLMVVLVEIEVFTFFESLICLKYTGKILDMLIKKSQNYERFIQNIWQNLLQMQSQIRQCSKTYSVLM